MNTDNIPENRKINLKEYKIVNKIGFGSFATVYEVMHKKSQKRFAAKVMKDEYKNDNESQLREIQILAQIEHPTIIKFHGYSEYNFDDRGCYTIITDLAEYNLENYLRRIRSIRNQEDFDFTPLQIILIGIARGMMILHENKIEHRDLKPSNILLDKANHPHIGDFGLAKKLEKICQQTQSKDQSTVIYQAPEMMDDKPHYSLEIDVYAFGIILYEAITNLEPYPEKSVIQIINLVKEGKRPEIPDFVTRSFRILIEKCWNQDIKKRPSFEEIYKSLAFNEKLGRDDYTDRDYFLKNVNKSSVFKFVQSIDKKDNTDLCVHETNNGLNEDIYIPFLLKYLEKAEKEKKELKIQINDITSKKDSLKNSKSKMQELIDSINQKNKKFKTENANLINENEKLKKSNKQMNDKTVQLEETIKELKRVLDNSNTPSNTPSKPTPPPLPQNTKPRRNTIASIPRQNRLDLRAFSKSSQAQNQILTDIQEIEKIALLSKIAKKEQELIKSISIDSFNKISGQNQFTIFHEFFIAVDKDDNLKKVNSILRRISDFVPKGRNDENKLNFIEIRTDKPNRPLISLIENYQILDSIYIASWATECLYSNNKLTKNSDFCKNEIKNFKEMIIEYDISSVSSTQIRDSIYNLKADLENEVKIDAALYFSQIIDADEFTKKNIKYIKIGSQHKMHSYLHNFKEFEELVEVCYIDLINEIGERIFADCQKLKKVVLPNSLREIPIDAFKNCPNLVEVAMPSLLETIGNSAFINCTSLSKIDLPNSITSIGSEAFKLCTSLKEISIPINVEKIDKSTFFGCCSLENVQFPDFLVRIEFEAFSGCDNLKDLSIPTQVKIIGPNSLKCQKLEKIVLPGRFKTQKEFRTFGIPGSTKVTNH
ncbi:hypothetical protein M9Y10_019821 [Tritrichomonas musculus]|uniref:Protein kinase domain-containing protein n=1 Tax=Tritrichomonas musculus TaxID=1915356 RepID=A0ABR2HHD0_9EUKA